MAEPPSTKPAYEPVKGLPRVPTPGEVEQRRAKRAPTLTGAAPFGRDNCVDTGVGIGFKSVDRFDLLLTYIGARSLMVLDDVVTEINRNADKVLEPGHAHVKAQVRQACRGLRKEINDGNMTVRELLEDFLDEVDEVQALVRKHGNGTDADGDDGHHAGEAASIVWARSQRPVAIILTNDRGAQGAATECGVAWLNAAQIMEILVRHGHGHVDADTAWDLINQMDKVSGIAGPFPVDASWRMTTR